MQKFKSKLQRLFLISVFLCCGFSVLSFSLFRCVFCQERLTSGKILAVEEMTAEEEKTTEEVTPTDEEITEEPTLTPTPKPVDYYLVYPGILPDHFLYPLKMVRDRIWLFLTTGPKRKAEVMLLFADKRLGAGKALIEGGKERLGVSTITKGEKYLEQSVSQLQAVKERGEDVNQLKEKFSKAAAKHEGVLLELKEKVSTEEWGVMDKMLEKIKMMREGIDSF